MIKTFHFKANIYRVENMHPKKYFVVFEQLSKKVQFYHNQTLELVHIIESPHIRPWKIKGNQEQSMFICQDRNGECGIITEIG